MKPRRDVALPHAVEVRRGGRVEYHFPVEIHLDEKADRTDIDKIATEVYERLIRRIEDV